MRKLPAFSLFIVVLVIAFDQGSKHMVLAQLQGGSDARSASDVVSYHKSIWYEIGQPPKSKASNPPYFAVGSRFVANAALMWSTGHSRIRAEWVRLLGVLGIIVIICISAAIFFKPVWQEKLPWKPWGIAAILAGGVSNSLDRVWHGFVVDWIDVIFTIAGRVVDFPNFNLADAAIVIGIILGVRSGAWPRFPLNT